MNILFTHASNMIDVYKTGYIAYFKTNDLNKFDLLHLCNNDLYFDRWSEITLDKHEYSQNVIWIKNANRLILLKLANIKVIDYNTILVFVWSIEIPCLMQDQNVKTGMELFDKYVNNELNECNFIIDC